MPRFKYLLVPLALAALSPAGNAHAEARRSAQSLPAPSRISPPSPVLLRTFMPVMTTREEPQRAPLSRTGNQEQGERSRSGRGGNDNRRNDRDRDDHGHSKDRDEHEFEHHGRGDSPGS